LMNGIESFLGEILYRSDDKPSKGFDTKR